MDRLLARVRDALTDVHRVSAPGPVPASGARVEGDLAAAFGAALEAAGGRLAVAPDESAARRLVADLWPSATIVDARGLVDEKALGRAEVGVDRADRLIAETGTVVRGYASRTAARVALVPPVSVFFAERSALVRDLPQALARVAEDHARGRAYTVLITGPSRTADIEKQLVIPAHGPRELLVVLVEKGPLQSEA